MKIIIEQKGDNYWNVTTGEMFADKLGFDEMLGLVAQLTVKADSGKCLNWLKPKGNKAKKKQPLFPTNEEIAL